MFLFSLKSSIENSGFFADFTDWHSHILPGVDDGIPTMEKALDVLNRYEQLGIGNVWLTPHIMEDIPNETSSLRERFRELTSEYHGPIHLHLASENMLDNLFEERLESDDFLPIGDSRHILVETSYYNPPMNLHDTIDRIMKKGYQPILAHPERYVYMEMDEYKILKEKNVMFQSNITSFTGIYGKDAYTKICAFLSKGWIDLFGSDIHNLITFNHTISDNNISKKCLHKLLVYKSFLKTNKFVFQ